MEDNHSIGVIFLGDTAVGKTTILHKLCNEDIDPVPTISPGTFSLNADGVNLLLYDTAGQERFRSTATFFYNKASIALVVFDISNHQTFQNLDYWISSLHDYMDQLKLILIGNKIDLVQDFDPEKIKKLADDLDCTYVLTSATTGTGINDLFNLVADLASNIKSSVNLDSSIDINQDPDKKSGCC